MESEVDSIMSIATSAEYPAATSIKYATGFFKQLEIVSKRALRNLIRNPMVLYFNLLASVVLGLTAGVVYFDISSSYVYGIQNR